MNVWVDSSFLSQGVQPKSHGGSPLWGRVAFIAVGVFGDHYSVHGGLRACVWMHTGAGCGH